MDTVTGYTAEHMAEIENDTVIGGSVVANELILVTKGEDEINLGTIVQTPSGINSEIVVLGKNNEFGSVPGVSESSTGERIETIPITNFAFQPGMGPFFSQVLPDGTVAMPQIPLTINQVHTTGKNMSMSFWSKQESVFYTVIVPTTEGAVETLAVNSITGEVGVSGGADLSDCAVVEIDGVPVLFALSALTYRGWDIEVYGEYPTLAAFIKSEDTGRWVYSEELSIFPAELQASDPTNGADVWPNTTNYFEQTVVGSKLPSELTVLPNSNHLAIAIYGLQSGSLSGSIVVVDPEAKTQAAYYEFPDFSAPNGATFTAFPRDINADPTSDVDDERILMNFDTFTQPSEKFNIIVNATGGTFTVSWEGVPTTDLDLGATEKEVQDALEAIAGIGVGNINVKLYRPFLVETFSVYQCTMIGDKRATNYSTIDIEIDVTNLVDDNDSNINRWQTGGTGYTKQGPFPLVELSYDATDGELTLLTGLLLPQDGGSAPADVPELIDAKFSMTQIDSDGTLWVTVHGMNGNPQASTSLTFRGMHAWRKVDGDRRYVIDHPPLAGWETRYGEAQPWPDLMTDALHQENNTHVLAVAKDEASGGVIGVSSNGKVKISSPTPALVNRTSNLLLSTEPEDWTVLSGGSHTGEWDVVEEAYAVTAGSVNGIEARSATGLSGIPIPESYEGQLLQIEIDVKGETDSRAQAPVARFYDEDGVEIGVLTGYGPAYMNSKTDEYTTIVGCSVIPVGTRYLSAGVTIKDPEIGEVHFIKRAIAYLAACLPVPDVNLGVNALYDDVSGNQVVAKGFVDPETRRLWLPYLQSMTQGAALNTVHPAWLVGLDLSRKLADRRPALARIPLSHSDTHAPGGSDPLTVDHIEGAAPIASPEFTGVVTIGSSGVEGPPDLAGADLTTAGLRWDASLGVVLVTNNTDRWRVGTTGHLTPIDNNLYDIGASLARVKDVHLAGLLYFAGLTASYITGSPEGVTTAIVGSVRFDTNGVIWLKVNGTGNTGWAAIGHNVFNRQTASYELVITDRNKTVEMNVAGANNLTVPLNSSVAFPVGSIVNVKQYGAGLTTIVATGGVSVRSRGGLMNSAGQYASMKLEKVGTDEWYLSGDLA